MKLLPLFVLLLGLAAAAPAQGIRPVADEAAARALPTRPTPGPSAAVWGLAVPVERPRHGPLLVVDGRPLPDSAEVPPAEDIIGLRELEPAEAMRRYGQRARHGVLLIETEKRQPRPKQ